MRIGHFAAAAILVLAAAGGIRQGESELLGRAHAVSSETTGAVRTQSYRVAINGGERDCVLRPGRRLGEAARQLDLPAGCDVAAISAARLWIERPDGDVALAGADGRVLIEFGASDGAALESFRPAEPMVTLTAER